MKQLVEAAEVIGISDHLGASVMCAAHDFFTASLEEYNGRFPPSFGDWAKYRALSDVYYAGIMQGVRQERQKRQKERKK